MGTAALYALAAFMETSIGIWIFGQVFPKRKRMEKKHVFGEWLLFAFITACAYSFPNTFWGIANKQKHVRNLILVHLILVLFFVIIGLLRKQNRAKENAVAKGILFGGIVVCMTAQYWTSYQAYSMNLIGNIFPVFYTWVFYECSFVQSYLWEFTYATNLGMFKNIYMTYVGVFGHKSFEDFFYWPRSHTSSEALYIIIIYCLIILVNRYIPLKNALSQILNKNKKVLFIFTFSEWFLLFLITENGMGTIKKNNLTFSLLIALIIVFCLTLLYIKSIMRNSFIEKKLFEVRNKIIARQYHELNTVYEQYRCAIHDEKHMLLYLQECLNQNEIDTAKKFLNSYNNEINKNRTHSWTGITNLDFLLNIKKTQIDESSIKFHLDCQIEVINLEDADFVVLLGNLLDNAIEAAEKCEIEDREIYLSLKNINNMTFFKLRNSCMTKPNHNNFRFFTSKENPDDHGWGIESVKHIVNKYHGEISFHYDNAFFEVTIFI